MDTKDFVQEMSAEHDPTSMINFLRYYREYIHKLFDYHFPSEFNVIYYPEIVFKECMVARLNSLVDLLYDYEKVLQESDRFQYNIYDVDDALYSISYELCENGYEFRDVLEYMDDIDKWKKFNDELICGANMYNRDNDVILKIVNDRRVIDDIIIIIDRYLNNITAAEYDNVVFNQPASFPYLLESVRNELNCVVDELHTEFRKYYEFKHGLADATILSERVERIWNCVLEKLYSE